MLVLTNTNLDEFLAFLCLCEQRSTACYNIKTLKDELLGLYFPSASAKNLGLNLMEGNFFNITFSH